MSVQIIATTRRLQGAPYEQPMVMIRVAGRTFALDCSSRQEALEVATSIQSEFKRHYEDEAAFDRRASRGCDDDI